jgi:hypothetical protein
MTTKWGRSYRTWRLGNVLIGKTSLTVAPYTKITGPGGIPKK